MHTNDTLSLSLCHHQSDIVSCYGKRYEKRYVNDGDKRYRNDATTIEYFLRVYKEVCNYTKRYNDYKCI